MRWRPTALQKEPVEGGRLGRFSGSTIRPGFSRQQGYDYERGKNLKLAT